MICLFLSLPLQAAETRGLYEAEVAVPEQSTTARTEGMRQALSAVLLKVSGASRVTGDVSLKEALESPARYVTQYRYRSEAIPEAKQTKSADGKVIESRLLLQVNFDQKSVDGLLRSHGYSVWGEARPATLIWLGVEDKGSRVLVGANDGGLLREVIDEESERRALPVKLPLLDLTDQSSVRTVDVWGDFLDTIKAASQRYGAQAILVGRLYPLSTRRWEARWTLDYRDQVSRWQSQSDEVAPLISEAVDRVADHLALSFAQSFVAGSGELLMRVEDVRNLKDYRRVLDYLRGVHGVKQAVAETLSADTVRFRLSTEGGSEAVLQVIALGNTLERVAQPPPADTVVPMRALPQRELPPGAADSRQEAIDGQAAAASATDSLSTGSEPTPADYAPPQPELLYRLLP